MRLAQEVAHRPVALPIDHGAGRAAADAELVLDRNALEVVARTERAVRVDQELRHDEQRNALHPGRGALDSRQHQMNDVGGEVVLAIGDEDLLAVNPVMIAPGYGARAHLREVRPGLRLGEIHGAGPLSAHHPRQVERLLRARSALRDRLGRALGQHWAQPKRQVGRCDEFLHRRDQQDRHALTAVRRGGPQLRPSARDELSIGVFEARGCRHAGLRPARAVAVRGFVERVQDIFGDARRLLQHARGELRRVFGEVGTTGQCVGADHVVECELDVLKRCAIHGVIMPRRETQLSGELQSWPHRDRLDSTR